MHGEGFHRDGKTFAYFGILPALLRIPLVPFIDLTAVSVEGAFRLAGLVGIAAGGLALVDTTLASVPPGRVRVVLAVLTSVSAVLSGPGIMLALRPDIFNEVALLAWALCVWFLAVLLPALRADARPSTRRLVVLAVLAGCCVLTRPTVAIGLLLVLAAVLARQVLRAGPEQGALPLRRAFDAIRQPRIVLPAMIVLVFLACGAAVNMARWGNPLTFADLRLQTNLLALHPDRLPRLDAYGMFNLERVWLSLIYFFLPIWTLRRDGTPLFEADIHRLFDAFELPPSSFFLTDPFTMLLAGIGAVALLRGRLPGVDRGLAVAVAGGFAVPAALILTAWYLAFRYRIEFMPLLLLLASLGVIRLAAWCAGTTAPRRAAAMTLLGVLLAAQVVSAHVHCVLYGMSPFGPSRDIVAQGVWDYYAQRLAPR
jgi:hypothetical protein